MPTVTKFANANTVVTTGWTSPTDAYSDNAVYATAAPAKNSSITTDYGFPAFTTSDIPAGSTINSVTVEIQYKSSTTSSTGSVIGVQINNNGTLLGSETTFGMNLSDQTVTKQATSGIALSDLQTANLVKARVRGARASSNTAITWSLDYVKVTVDYTVPPVTPTGLGSAQAFGTVTIIPGAVSKSVSGIPSAQAFGTQFGIKGGIFYPSVHRFPSTTLYPTGDAGSGGQTASVSGIASAQAFGTITVVPGPVTKAVSGIGSAQSFGTPRGNLAFAVNGVGSAQAFGAPTVTVGGTGQTVTPSGLASAASFGSVTPQPGPVTATVSGIGSAQSFGSPKANQTKPVSGVSTAQAFGSVTPVAGPVVILIAGVSSAQAFGNVTTSGGNPPTFSPAIHGGHHHHY